MTERPREVGVMVEAAKALLGVAATLVDTGDIPQVTKGPADLRQVTGGIGTWNFEPGNAFLERGRPVGQSRTGVVLLDTRLGTE